MSAFDTRYLSCRDLGHAWEPKGDVVRSRTETTMSFARVLVCARCQTERRDEYRFASDTIRRRKAGYAYPKGYQVKGGMSRGEARMMLWMPRTESQQVGKRAS